MSANPIIQSVRGVPTGTIPIDRKLALIVELVNVGDEGDVYLNCFCHSASYTANPPYDMGTRLQNWRPAAAGQFMIYSETRGLIPETDPVSFGLCAGCHPDGDCWPDPSGLTTLTFVAGYLIGAEQYPTDSVTAAAFSVGSSTAGGVSWPLIAGGVGAIALIYLATKKR